MIKDEFGVQYSYDMKVIYNCPNLSGKYEIPYGVEYIANYAFRNCKNLYEVNIPKSVKKIGFRAFEGCNMLQYIKIPEGLEEIGDYAFCGCYSVKYICISSSVSKIGKAIIGGRNNLSSITVDNNNKWYDSRNNCNAIIETSSDTLILGCSKTIIPESVSCIFDMAFFGCLFLEIYLPHNVVSIGSESFGWCRNLQRVVVSNNLNHIGNEAFRDCCALKSFELSNDIQTTKKKTEEPSFSIGDKAFENCISLESITIPYGIKTIGRDSFGRCPKLKQIDLPENLIEIGNNAFHGTSIKSIKIPSSVIHIGSHAFDNCNELESVNIPDSVIYIGDGAFEWCRKLQYIHIPNKLKHLNYRVFAGCMISYIKIPNSVVRIENEAFYSCELNDVEIPHGTDFIGKRAFADCSRLEHIFISDSVKIIIDNPFENGNIINSIVVDKGNQQYDSRDNCNAIVETSTNTIITGCGNTKITKDITIIGRNAFQGCDNLFSIEIPRNVRAVEQKAFDYCHYLTTITICNEDMIFKGLGDGFTVDLNKGHLKQIIIPRNSKLKILRNECLKSYEDIILEQ